MTAPSMGFPVSASTTCPILVRTDSAGSGRGDSVAHPASGQIDAKTSINVALRQHPSVDDRRRHTRVRREERGRPTSWKSWWARTGSNRRHQDFQSWNTSRGSTQKVLLRNHESFYRHALECSGVIRNALIPGTFRAHAD